MTLSVELLFVCAITEREKNTDINNDKLIFIAFILFSLNCKKINEDVLMNWLDGKPRRDYNSIATHATATIETLCFRPTHRHYR